MEKSIRFHISPRVMEWVIQNSDFDNLPDEWQMEVARWLDFDERPTIDEIRELSELLYIPFGYFFLDFPPTEDCALFELRTLARRKKKRPSRNLIETAQDMEQMQRELSGKRNRLDYNICRFVGAGVANQEAADKAALLIFEALKIDEDWLSMKDYQKQFEILQNQLAVANASVMMGTHVSDNPDRVLDIKEFRAFLLLDEYAPVIFINANDSWKKMLFSLVHEVVHMWMGTAELFDGGDNLKQKFRNPGCENRAYEITRTMLGY